MSFSDSGEEPSIMGDQTGLTGQTIRQAFKVREASRALPYPFLVYDVSVWKNGKQVGLTSNNNCLLLSNEDANSSLINSVMD